MKKILSLLLVLGLCVGLVGCSTKKEDKSKENDSVVDEKEIPSSLDVSSDYKYFDITVSDFEKLINQELKSYIDSEIHFKCESTTCNVNLNKDLVLYVELTDKNMVKAIKYGTEGISTEEAQEKAAKVGKITAIFINLFKDKNAINVIEKDAISEYNEALNKLEIGTPAIGSAVSKHIKYSFIFLCNSLDSNNFYMQLEPTEFSDQSEYSSKKDIKENSNEEKDEKQEEKEDGIDTSLNENKLLADTKKDILASDSGAYIKDMVVETSGYRKIKIAIVVSDGVSREMALDIADTAIRRLSSNANIQNSYYSSCGSSNYGSFYTSYSLQIGIANLSEASNRSDWLIDDTINNPYIMLK